MNELAIASIPIQEWEEPYDLPRALREGTIFPQLNKLFYIEEEMKDTPKVPLSDCEAKELALQQVTFCLTEVTMFLKTHPDHAEAKRWQLDMQEQRKKMMKAFAKEHYPLTMDCVGQAKEEPVPWEGVKENVGL